MDFFRYGLATFIISMFPTAMAFWLIVHPFIHFWRRFHPTIIYAAVFAMMTPLLIGLYWLSPALLIWDWGYRSDVTALGMALFLLSVIIVLIRQRYFPIKTLSGLPELDPQRHKAELITHGIYRLIRHPRYLEFCLFGLAASLIANHPAAYACTLLCWGLIYVIVIFEERELRERWGEKYLKYCRTTPRFIPHWNAVRQCWFGSE